MGRFSLTATLAALGLALVATGCAGDIQVGAVVSENGFGEPYGSKVKKGLDLAMEEINAAGGVNGRPLTLVYRDDASDSKTGVEVTRELIDDVGVDMIIGAVTSPVTLAIAPICEENRVVLLSPTASAPQITEAGNYVFRNYPSDILEGTSMADFARDLGLSTVVVFAVDNEFGSGLKNVFVQKYENRFREVVKTFDFREGDAASLAQMVEQALSLKPEGIYLVGYIEDVAELLRLLHEGESDSVMMGTASITGEVVSLIGEAAEHLVYPQPPFDVDSDEAEVSTFVEAYRSKYGEEPDTFAAHGYDALKILAFGIERGGGTLADDVRNGVAGIDNFRGASGTASFDSNGDVVQYPRLFIIHEGQPMPYERFLEEGGSLALSDRG